MNKTTEALKLAEEALNAMLTQMGMDEDEWTKPTFDQSRKALAAIREALAEPVKQEPYAYEFDLVLEGVDKVGYPILTKDAASIARMRENPNFSIKPLYAAPVSAKREWVDLTDDEIDESWCIEPKPINGLLVAEPVKQEQRLER